MSDDRPAANVNSETKLDIVSVQTLNGRWQSRLRGHDYPVGEGKTAGESARELRIRLKLTQGSAKIEEKFDPFV